MNPFRQLLNDLRTRFEQLSAREKRLVMAAGGAVLIFILFLTVMSFSNSANTHRRRTQEKLPKLQQVQQLAASYNQATAARNAMVNYASTLSAHLQRFKRPAKGRGTVVVNFTVNRSGKVVARSVVRSSGSAAVDAEAMAMIERAQPMPPFPAAVTQSQESFVQAIRFR